MDRDLKNITGHTKKSSPKLSFTVFPRGIRYFTNTCMSSLVQNFYLASATK